jgi:triosephosphate isomerase (TIM)
MVLINRDDQGRIPIIAGNWKMNKSAEEAVNLVDDMLEDLEVFEGVEIVVAPAFVALYPVWEQLQESRVKLAAQNMYYKDSGAFTGEVSPLMLRELCDYVIIGHSERRQYFHETDEDVNLKVQAAFRHDLTPIMAIGETLAQRQADQTADVIVRQLKGGLKDIGPADMASLVIAYEPIWAIGTGLAATGEQANVVTKLIRDTVAGLYDETIAQQIRIQYGGSVTGDNIAEFISQPDIDGALVGGASLKPVDFIKIVATTQEITFKKQQG